MSVLLLGGGGHAATIIDALRSVGEEPRGIVERDATSVGTSLLDVEIVGTDDELASLRAAGAESFIVTLGSTGNASARRAVFDRGLAAGLAPKTVVHAAAWVSPSAALGGGVTVGAGAVINAQARVGDNVIVNTGAIVEHDCEIGAHVHVAPGAVIAAAVVVGDGAHIGAGASVRQGIRIGEGAVVGMGAAVVSDVAPGVTVVGVPALPKGQAAPQS